MNKFSILFLLSVVMLLASCNSAKKTDSPDGVVDSTFAFVDIQEIPFTIADRYFLKNNADVSKIKGNVIETAELFNELFGAAAVMGTGGKPSEIDFTTQYVIPVIVDQTNKTTNIVPITLAKDGENINLTYQLTQGEEQSYTIQPLLLVVVDKANAGTVSLSKQ